jgi:hypothetical protein
MQFFQLLAQNEEIWLRGKLFLVLEQTKVDFRKKAYVFHMMKLSY